MKDVNCVAVVGLGLMGGSLARALAARGVRVIGFDADALTSQRARADGVLGGIVSADFRELATAQVIVIATPVDSVLSLLPSVLQQTKNALLVMDLASTKRSIVECAESSGLGERFVGAHPLTGSHLSGWEASRDDLYTNAEVFLCATQQTSPDALSLATEFWLNLGARTTMMDATEHDEQMALRSHLPHVASCALARTLRGKGIGRADLGPGGRDVTRLSGSSASLWASIAGDNRIALMQALDAFRLELDAFRAALAGAQDTEPLFAESTGWFNGE